MRVGRGRQAQCSGSAPMGRCSIRRQRTMSRRKLRHCLRSRSASHWTPQRSLRSEEHTSELQSLMRISYAVFCLKKKNKTTNTNDTRLETPPTKIQPQITTSLPHHHYQQQTIK